MRVRLLVSSAVLAALLAARPWNAESPGEQVNAIATAYLHASMDYQPESAPSDTGWMAPLAGRIGDNSPAALSKWHAYQDSVLNVLKKVDAAALVGHSEWITYGILRGSLESDIGTRICRQELWGVNSYVNGWQNGYSDVFAQQRVGNTTRRQAALARARALPRFIDNEIANLREGVRLGYTSPAIIVRNVIRQMDDLTTGAPESSPFYSPAERDTARDPATTGFRRELAAEIKNGINPAIRRYRDYLANEYLPRARNNIAVSSNPNGLECYRAVTRYFSTMDVPPDSVFALGQREMRRVDDEMRAIATKHFATSDVPALLVRFKTDPKYTFRTRQEVIDYSQAAVDRSKAAMPKWFGLLPGFDVVIQPYPEFRQRAGAPGQLNTGAPNDRPSVFLINTWDPLHKSRADIESTAFHEAIPGHHLQGAIALERKDLHPFVQLAYNSGFGEGWALYAERLADEMGLYSSPMSEIGMLTSEAFRAARCLIDAGIHTRGWTRQQAIDTLAAHTTLSRSVVEGEVDRYISWPGQAPSYMIGRTEIMRLRQMAKDSLGDRFDIRQFHDRVLENGTVTLPMLRENIARWIAKAPR
ncbi:MAG TPA: DUF885 domain-containing protein [Gemmatimonadaceae bacterium]|nr:DUF885 domain-containing protein [Gemmatimonadaceae bacterium]